MKKVRTWKGHLYLFMTIIFLNAAGSVLTGCESTYKPGDLTRSYCASADLKFRASVRALLKTQGIVLPVDPCLAIGVIDVLKAKPEP